MPLAVDPFQCTAELFVASHLHSSVIERVVGHRLLERCGEQCIHPLHYGSGLCADLVHHALAAFLQECGPLLCRTVTRQFSAEHPAMKCSTWQELDWTREV